MSKEKIKMSKTRSPIVCRYSDSCFTCPLKECKIAQKDASKANPTKYDIEVGDKNGINERKKREETSNASNTRAKKNRGVSCKNGTSGSKSRRAVRP